MRSRPAILAFTISTLCGALTVAGCQRQDAPASNPKTANVPTDETRQVAVPAPPGDITPKAAEDAVATPNPATEKAGRSTQSTVGSAASGAPPYTLQGAPEGNAAPKGGDVKK